MVLSFRCKDIMYRTDLSSSFMKCVICRLKSRTGAIKHIKSLPGQVSSDHGDNEENYTAYQVIGLGE